MDEERVAVEILDEDGIIVAVPQTSRILDELNISHVGTQLTEAIANTTYPKIILDFEKVTNMSSSALGMLITVHKRVRESNGEMRLCNICPNIEEVFAITRLDEIFIIDADRADSLKKIKSH